MYTLRGARSIERVKRRVHTFRWHPHTQGAFSVKLTPEVRQKLLRCTLPLKVGVYLKCKDQQNRATRFAVYYASTPKSAV